jgi:hypothetical protein
MTERQFYDWDKKSGTGSLLRSTEIAPWDLTALYWNVELPQDDAGDVDVGDGRALENSGFGRE